MEKFTIREGIESGNSTVNVIANSVQITMSSNLLVNSSMLHVGNATVNCLVNSTGLYTASHLISETDNGLVYLTSGTITNATVHDVDFSSYSGLYTGVRFVVQSWRPDAATAQVGLRLSTDGGSTFESGANDYSTIASHTDWEDDGVSGFPNNADWIPLSGTIANTAAEGGWSGTIDIYDTFSTTHFTKLFCEGQFLNSGDNDSQTTYESATVNIVQDTTGLQFRASSGNVNGGTWQLYGFIG